MTISRAQSLTELFAFSDLEKKSHSTLITNCYYYAEYFRNKVEDDCVYLITEKDSAIILTEILPSSFSLHFFTTNLKSFEKILRAKAYGRQTIVELPNFIDSTIMKIFQGNGFLIYETFIQLLSKPKSLLQHAVHLEKYSAERVDAKEILELLETYFDPKVDQIPSLFQIDEYIKNGNVFVLKEDNRLASCVIFFKSKRSLKVHYLVTNPAAQGRGNAAKLLRLLSESSSGVVSLWVKESNHNALEFYGNQGFYASGNKRYFLEGVI